MADDALVATVASLMQVQHVAGVALSDDHGLCVAARGSLREEAAARLQALYDAATALGTGELPTVRVETATTDLLLANHDGLLTTVARSKQREVDEVEVTKGEAGDKEEEDQEEEDQEEEEEEAPETAVAAPAAAEAAPAVTTTATPDKQKEREPTETKEEQAEESANASAP